ncbi:MAG: PQQ-dependent sugar dehydrogenase [Alphaproteobacteria bacterium]|nr:PQQ-dependent sugar dehydrogenase [Alphaproteobacteria bacterium]
MKSAAASLFGMALVLAAPAEAQDRPGQVFHLPPEDMPAPYATESVSNSSDTVPRGGREPDVPDGFEIRLFAQQVGGPRKMLVDAGGLVIVARSRAGTVSVLPDEDGNGRADEIVDVVRGLSRPHGLALHDGYLWIADTNRLYRVPWRDGGGPADDVEAVSRDGVFGSGSGHWTRNIAFSPDGRYLYASIGSRGNISREDPPRATIQRFEVDEDGLLGPGETFAAGLRNPVGIAVRPEDGRLYTVVNERDGMGDGLVPDYFTEVRQGAFYGWPYAYIGAHPQPGFGEERPDLVAQSVVPDVLIQSHSAPIGLAFLADADVPEAWRDDALVTLRGSWNAAEPTGYKVVRIEFENGRPTGRYVNFATGFRIDVPNPATPGPARVWGRPVGVAIGPDGAIYIGDEIGGTIWRITRKP